MRRIVGSLGVALLAMASPSPLIAQEEGATGTAITSTTEGVYSEAQAARGEQLMWGLCSECHVDADFGAPFIGSWEGATVRQLIEEIKATMPEDNPGALPENQYVDFVAFVFRLNGLPAGDEEMEADDLDSIKISVEP